MKAIWLAGAAFLTMVGPALAIDVQSAMMSKASPAAMWKAIGGFCGIADWHPAFSKCVESDAGGVKTRVLTLKGGGEIKEQLVARDDTAMQYTYKILESPLPIADYKSTISVKGTGKEGDGSEVSWTGHFTAKGASDADVQKLVQGVYDAGLANLVKVAK